MFLFWFLIFENRLYLQYFTNNSCSSHADQPISSLTYRKVKRTNINLSFNHYNYGRPCNSEYVLKPVWFGKNSWFCWGYRDLVKASAEWVGPPAQSPPHFWWWGARRRPSGSTPISPWFALRIVIQIPWAAALLKTLVIWSFKVSAGLSLIVPDFTISVYGSSCNSLYLGLIIVPLGFLFQFIGIPQGRTECQEK